jgi:hypothetical protein
MTFLEFIEIYKTCEVSARLCLGAVEHDYDAVEAMTDDEFVQYRDFIRNLSAYWLCIVYKQCPAIENEIVWSSFGGDDWNELLKFNPDWQWKKESHYRAPKFFSID